MIKLIRRLVGSATPHSRTGSPRLFRP